MLGTERHDGFFPWLGVAKPHLGATRLSFAILSVHFQHFHLKQFLNGRPHVCFGRQLIDFERIGIAARWAVHPLLGHQRLDDDLMRLQDDAGLLWYVSRHILLTIHYWLFGYQLLAETAFAAVAFALIWSSASGVINNRREESTFKALSSDAGETETPPMLRALL